MAGYAVTFFALLITVSTALTTYNIVTSTWTSVKHEFPSFTSKSALVSNEDPVVRLPIQSKRESKPFHTAVTADGSVYNTWQSRVMYYWYKKNRGPDMGGFTRILHSGQPDSHMDEIPTFVAQPLPPGVDEGYVVLNRPWALQQWLEQADIQEEYIWMAEPDHLIVKPIPNLATDKLGAAFPFFYIEPAKHGNILAKHFPDGKLPDTKMDPIGNSPVIIPKDSLKKIVPSWVNISISLKKDKETNKAFGWVLEMYAYSAASALHGTNYILRKDFMIQPPWDTHIDNKFIIHYTYGCDYDLKGNFMPGKYGEWRFDKRSYHEVAPPRNLAMPPKGVPESVVTMIKMFNEATANIPNWESWSGA